jgi:hypothetical protein
MSSDVRCGRRRLAALLVAAALLLCSCAAERESPANTAGQAPPPVETSTPLPADGFKATLSLAAPPKELKAGQKTTLQVKVRNASTVTWPARERSAGGNQVHLGNHWLDTDNKMLQLDDGRGTLPDDLGPGAEVTLPLEITAPAKPGSYVLELDMVQEGVSWFGAKGAQTLRLPVRVSE